MSIHAGMSDLYIGELATALFYLGVGWRLKGLAAQTEAAPERVLATLFLLTGCSYLFYWLPVPNDLRAPLDFSARLVYLPAPVMLAVFTRKVFRPKDGWSAWLVYATAVLMVASLVGSAAVGDWEGFSISHPWFWVEWLAYTAPFAWAAVEALLQRAQARRRLALDLCTPLVCNRFLLWGLFGLSQVCVSVVILAQYADYKRHGVWSSDWDLVVGAIEIFSVALVWLVFFAPQRYRLWVEGTARPAGAVAD